MAQFLNVEARGAAKRELLLARVRCTILDRERAARVGEAGFRRVPRPYGRAFNRLQAIMASVVVLPFGSLHQAIDEFALGDWGMTGSVAAPPIWEPIFSILPAWMLTSRVMISWLSTARYC